MRPSLSCDVAFLCNTRPAGMSAALCLRDAASHTCPLPVCSLNSACCSSIAGLYLASAGMDQALCLWDVNERTCLEKRLLPGSATGLAWHPAKNELAVISEDGGLFSPSCVECLLQAGSMCGLAWRLCQERAGGDHRRRSAVAFLTRHMHWHPAKHELAKNGQLRDRPAAPDQPLSLCPLAGQLAVWQEPVPTKLPPDCCSCC